MGREWERAKRTRSERERLIRPSINIRPSVKLLSEGRKHGLEKEKRF